MTTTEHTDDTPVRRIGREVIRPGQVVSTVIAAGNAETVTFTQSDGIDSHQGFEVAVVHGPPDGAAGQHRRVIIEARARAAATATRPRPAPPALGPHQSPTPTPRRLP